MYNVFVSLEGACLKKITLSLKHGKKHVSLEVPGKVKHKDATTVNCIMGSVGYGVSGV